MASDSEKKTPWWNRYSKAQKVAAQRVKMSPKNTLGKRLIQLIDY